MKTCSMQLNKAILRKWRVLLKVAFRQMLVVTKMGKAMSQLYCALRQGYFCFIYLLLIYLFAFIYEEWSFEFGRVFDWERRQCSSRGPLLQFSSFACFTSTSFLNVFFFWNMNHASDFFWISMAILRLLNFCWRMTPTSIKRIAGIKHLFGLPCLYEYIVFLLLLFYHRVYTNLVFSSLLFLVLQIFAFFSLSRKFKTFNNLLYDRGEGPKLPSSCWRRVPMSIRTSILKLLLAWLVEYALFFVCISANWEKLL